MRTRGFLLAGLLVVALLASFALARPAWASANLGLGADWIEGDRSELNLTLGVDSYLVRHLSLGMRGGVAFFDDGHHVAVPIDLRLTIHAQRIYFEGLAGPWFNVDSGDLFHVHGAFGFGIESGGLGVGLEVGSLAHATMVGLRVMLRW